MAGLDILSGYKRNIKPHSTLGMWLDVDVDVGFWYMCWRNFGTFGIPSFDPEIDIEGRIPVQVMVAFAAQEA